MNFDNLEKTYVQDNDCVHLKDKNEKKTLCGCDTIYEIPASTKQEPCTNCVKKVFKYIHALRIQIARTEKILEDTMLRENLRSENKNEKKALRGCIISMIFPL